MLYRKDVAIDSATGGGVGPQPSAPPKRLSDETLRRISEVIDQVPPSAQPAETEMERKKKPTK
jgi:hypothetical protein